MAFYSSDLPYCNSNYAQNRCDYGYNFISSQLHIDSSNYNIDEPRYYYPQYDTSLYYYSNGYQYVPSQSMVAYTAISDDSYYNEETFSTQSVVYCSVAEPSDLDFEEYDPDPFEGGYDIVKNYGKPLAPDDKICYPRSSFDPNLPPVDALPFKPVFAPYGKEEIVDDTVDNKIDSGRRGAEPEQKQKQSDGGDLGGGAIGDGAKSEKVIKEEDEIVTDDDEHRSDDGDGDDRTSDRAIREEDEMRDNGEKVYHMPPGYGLESLDLCEGFFGYWPCLWKRGRDGSTVGHGDDRCGDYGGSYGGEHDNGDIDPWKTSADCLFGNPDPYDGLMGHGVVGFGDPIHAYSRHHYQQPSGYEKVDYDENYWVL